jgi:deoxyadenosine/deoxycytidine kinase
VRLVDLSEEVSYYIVIAGNIGVGKTTLTELLSQRLGWEPMYETFQENPFLADFYDDMPRWAFHSQVFFLSQRLKQHHFLLQRNGSIVQDRSIYEDAEVFARNLHLQGSLGNKEWQAYEDLYRAIVRVLAPPNLLVYLQASPATLLSRIAHRGRDYESTISEAYITQLNDCYDDWIENFKLCPTLTIQTDALDYVRYEDHLDQILERISQHLHGNYHMSI